MVLSADPLAAAGNPASAAHRSLAASGTVPGMPLAPVNPAAQSLMAAQQELLYRELLSRAPYANDPALTQQVILHVSCTGTSSVNNCYSSLKTYSKQTLSVRKQIAAFKCGERLNSKQNLSKSNI